MEQRGFTRSRPVVLAAFRVTRNHDLESEDFANLQVVEFAAVQFDDLLHQFHPETPGQCRQPYVAVSDVAHSHEGRRGLTCLCVTVWEMRVCFSFLTVKHVVDHIAIF